MMNLILFALVAGAAVNFLLTPLAIRLAHRYGFLDRPGHRKIHDAPIPQLGGAAMTASILLALGITLLLFQPFSFASQDMTRLLFVGGVTLALAGVGFLDDRFDLKPSFKLSVQILVTGCFVFFGYRFELLHIPGFTPIGLSVLALPITVLWMAAVINGFNFMDGVDGLTGLVTSVCLIGLGYVSFTADEPGLQALAFTTLGAVLAFLAFNWNPAKIYMGNCGTNALGGLAAAFLVSTHKDATLFTHANPSMPYQPFPFQLFISTFLVGYPFLEAGLSTFRRGVKRFLFNRSMEGAEKEHIHHRLLKLGLSAPAICATASLLQVVFTAAALLVLFEQRALAVWVLAPLLMFLSFAMPRTGFFNFLNPRTIRHNHPHYHIVHHFILMQRAKLGLAENREEMLALLCQTCAELGVEVFHIEVKSDRGENGHCRYFWERKQDVAREYLSYIKIETGQEPLGHFQDRIALEGNRGEADWSFEPHTEEAELDVEYRVAVSDYMKEALARICALKNTDPTTDQGIEIDQLSHARVRSSLLRRKHASKEAAF
jgi:UDP-GlcNAc:undecaprenyl-phosphate GlcNAc-1-phosphate transferase